MPDILLLFIATLAGCYWGNAGGQSKGGGGAAAVAGLCRGFVMFIIAGER